MSVSQTLEVQCPRCEQAQDITAWQSVHTTQDPELKEQLLDRTLHQLTCSSCGEVTAFTLPMVVHDPSHPSMIWLSPDGTFPVSHAETLMENLPDEIIHRYAFRTVGSHNELIEKIRCFDDGLDDRVMELVKLLLLQQMMQQSPDLSVHARLYYSDTDTKQDVSKLHFVLVNPETETSKVAVLPRHVYDGVLSDFRAHLVPQPEWPTIDLAYAANLFQTFHQSKQSEKPS
ncbi:MAG: hypothetical protein EP343_27570 [Deltaproteobacteria bacterium]|nr:MAG: hypothetical protein EP343_27570 [Deltaproteobacteria bacterium]